MEPVFLSLDDILEIHGLESAIATPQATFGGEFLHVSIPAMAAAYLFHLCQNHAFIDGNKRVGERGHHIYGSIFRSTEQTEIASDL
jgi:death-on-curing protein